MHENSRGFSLTELLVTMSLALLISSLIFKVYEMQMKIYHKMEDIVFLDQNGVLAMKILKNEYGKGEFDVVNHALRFKKNKSNGGPQEVVSGVESLSYANNRITIEMKAPQGMKATFSEMISPLVVIPSG